MKKPSQLRYELQTNRYFTSEASSPEISFRVSLKNAHPGINVLPVEVQTSVPLSSATRIHLSSKTVKVILDRKTSKRIPARPLIHNTLSPEYILSDILFSLLLWFWKAPKIF